MRSAIRPKAVRLAVGEQKASPAMDPRSAICTGTSHPLRLPRRRGMYLSMKGDQRNLTV